jgi:hypothetical protein
MIQNSALLLLFSSFTIQANPITFDCSVKEILTFDKSASEYWIKGNLEKRFIVSVDEEDVIVTSISDIFSSGTSKYKISTKEFGLIKAINNDSHSMHKTVIVDLDSGDSTISIQGSFHTTVWLLGCKKQ